MPTWPLLKEQLLNISAQKAHFDTQYYWKLLLEIYFNQNNFFCLNIHRHDDWIIISSFPLNRKLYCFFFVLSKLVLTNQECQRQTILLQLSYIYFYH